MNCPAYVGLYVPNPGTTMDTIGSNNMVRRFLILFAFALAIVAGSVAGGYVIIPQGGPAGGPPHTSSTPEIPGGGSCLLLADPAVSPVSRSLAFPRAYTPFAWVVDELPSPISVIREPQGVSTVSSVNAPPFPGTYPGIIQLAYAPVVPSVQVLNPAHPLGPGGWMGTQPVPGPLVTPGVIRPALTPHITTNGTVVLVDGGTVYGIIADDKSQYLPSNLPTDMKVDGLRVRFTAIKQVLPGVTWGVPVIITAISVLKDEGIPPGPKAYDVNSTGTVRYIDLEGGFYGIIGDDGESYLPGNLDEAYQKDGLRVTFTGMMDENASNFYMWGVPITLISVRVLSLEQPEPSPVVYQRSGGIAGVDDALTLSADGHASVTWNGGSAEEVVPGHLQAALLSSLEAADFISLKARYPAPSGGADLFSYMITYRSHSVWTQDGGVPATLYPVIDILNEILDLVKGSGLVRVERDLLTTSEWKLTSYRGAERSLVQIPLGISVTARFGSDGALGGTAGCNLYFGDYQASQGTIAVGTLGMTEMYCEKPDGVMDLEQDFLTLLGTAARYTIEDGVLRMTDANGRAVLVFEIIVPDEDLPNLIGPVWLLTSIAPDGDLVSSVLAGTQITAEFGKDGTVSGEAGCNRFFGQYSADEGTIEIGSLGLTKMYCSTPDGVMDQEQAFIDLFSKGKGYILTNDSLMINDKDGLTILTFALRLRRDPA